MSHVEWIAVDWGTSHLRVWGLAGDTAVCAAQSDQGKVTLVIYAGMVGSRQDWIDAPYRAGPYTPLAPRRTRAPATDPRLGFGIIPGPKQPCPPDVMRGEEAQIAAYPALKLGWKRAGFADELEPGLGHPQRLLAHLSTLRAEGFLDGLSLGHARESPSVSVSTHTTEDTTLAGRKLACAEISRQDKSCAN